MAEHPNVTVARQMTDALARGDLAEAGSYLADDIVWHEIGRDQPRHGKAELQAGMGDVDYEITGQLHDIVGNDEHVIALIDATGTRNGRTLEYRVAEVYHVKDGKITERWAFSDDTAAIVDFFAEARAVTVESQRALVLRFVREIFEEGRPDALDDLVAVDFRSHTWGPQGAGREDLRQAMARVATSLADRVFAVEDTVVEGDLVAVRLTASATQVGPFMGIAASGRRYTIGEIHLFRVRDGRIVEHWHQYDVPGLLRQLGGPEPDPG